MRGGSLRILFRSLRRWTVTLLLLFLSCSPQDKPIPATWRVAFVPLGAKIHFDAEANRSIRAIRVYDADNALFADAQLAGHARKTESLFFAWERGELYRFEVIDITDAATVQVLNAPTQSAQGTMDIAIPYRITDAASGGEASDTQTETSLVLQGSTITATVVVRNGLEIPANFRVTLDVSAELDVLAIPDEWQRIGETYVASGTFTVESEAWYSQLSLRTPNLTPSESLQVNGSTIFNTPSDQWRVEKRHRLHVSTVDETARKIAIDNVLMPTDATGVFDTRQRPDAISHPQPIAGMWSKWLSRHQSIDPFQPIAYQTVRLVNHGQETIHVVVSSLIFHPKNGGAVQFLSPPDAINAGTDRVFAFASLQPETISDVPLPLYFNPEQTVSRSVGAGHYARRITVTLWGSDTPVIETTRPLSIISPNFHAMLVTIFTFIATGIGLIVFLRFHRLIFNRFTTQQLILISLFGTTIFIAVSVPSTLLSTVVSALLGPFAFLVTGVINELLYYVLLTSLLVALPKSGVITLVSAVRLLLGGITLGLLTPIAFIYTGVSVLLLEAGFWLVGKRMRPLVCAPIFGVCDALAVYVDFQLSITLYRLFYADWYILTRIFVDGFSYTVIGVWLGWRLGQSLRAVSQ